MNQDCVVVKYSLDSKQLNHSSWLRLQTNYKYGGFKSQAYILKKHPFPHLKNGILLPLTHEKSYLFLEISSRFFIYSCSALTKIFFTFRSNSRRGIITL